MQSPPAFEGMYLHGILHRIEGDYDNARAWYSDVKDNELYVEVWGKEGRSWKDADKYSADNGLDSGQTFLNRAQRVKENKNPLAFREMLERESKREIETVIDKCVEKFGTGRMEDASQAWVQPSDDIRKMGEDQVSGDAGRRKF